MADNAQVTPFARSLQRFTSTVSRAATRILGQSVPATLAEISGPIVKVNFEVTHANLPGMVEMPVLGSRYYRPPYQSGEKGFALSADYFMGGMSGLGGGTADLSQRGNLATAAWTPVGNKSWPGVDPDTNVVTGGPNGITLRDSESPGATITLQNDAIVLSCGGHNITIDSAGVIIDGRIFLLHEHTDVEPGGGISGPVL